MAPPKRRRVEAVAMPMSDEESSDDDSSLELSSDEDTDDDDPLGFNNNGNSRNGDDNNAEKSDGDGDEDEDEFEASSKCPVCFELLGEANIPKILKCGHTICDGCAGKMISRSLIKCPLCQASMRARRASDLATNYALKNVIEETMKKDEEHSAERAKWDEERQQLTSKDHRNDQAAPDASSFITCDSCKTYLTGSAETYACLDEGCTIAKEYKLSCESSTSEANSTRSITYAWRVAKRMCPQCICRHHLSHEVVAFEQVPSDVQIYSTLAALYRKMHSLRLLTPNWWGRLHPFKKVVEEVDRRFSDGLAKLSQSDKALTNEQWDEIVKPLGDLLARLETFFTASMLEKIQTEVLTKFLSDGTNEDDASTSSNISQ